MQEAGGSQLCGKGQDQVGVTGTHGILAMASHASPGSIHGLGIGSSRSPHQFCSASLWSILIPQMSSLCVRGSPATYPERGACWPSPAKAQCDPDEQWGGAIPHPQSNWPKRHLAGTTLCSNGKPTSFRCIFLSGGLVLFQRDVHAFQKRNRCKPAAWPRKWENSYTRGALLSTVFHMAIPHVSLISVT